MNIYYLRVLGSGVIFETEIKADKVSWSEAGMYVFSKLNKNSISEKIAFYPVDRTIIEGIDYNVDEQK